MKKRILLFLPCLVLLVGLFASCSESTEVGVYHDWQARNEAFIDSIKGLNPTLVETADAAAAMPEGELFSILVPTNSNTTDKAQYIYCKKITANAAGQRPLYQPQSVNVFYYGTLITGTKFDGNFKGYSALDQTFSGDKNPTEFDSTTTYLASTTSKGAGWLWGIQYMRTGERWMLYIPWKSGYGSTDNGSLPGYSTLTFDVKLVSIEN